VQRSARLLTLILLFLATFSVVFCGAWHIAWAKPQSAVFEDHAQPLDPYQPRDERAQDRIQASAHFSMARIHFQRENYSHALRNFQRAYRYDRSASSALQDIVSLAIELDQVDVAGRYAMIAISEYPLEPVLVRQLAMYLTEEMQFPQAIALHEAAMQAEQPTKQDATTVLLQLEMGRLYMLTEQHQKAADCFEVVRDSLSHPEKYRLTERLQKIVLGKPDLTYSLLAEGFLAAIRTDKAEEMFRQADKVEPDPHQLALNLARITAARGQYPVAMDHLEQYLQSNSTAGGNRAYKLLKLLLNKLRFDPQQVRNEFLERLQQKHAKQPDNTALGYFLANHYLKNGQFELAESVLSVAIKHEPTVEGFQSLVKLNYQLKNYDALLSLFEQAQTQMGTLDTLHRQLVSIAADDTAVAQLVQRAQQQIDKNHGLSVGAGLAVGLLTSLTSQHEISDSMFEYTLQVSPNTRTLRYMEWARQLILTERFATAADVLQRALKEKQNGTSKALCYYYLTTALEMVGETDQALTAADEAIRLDDTSILMHSRRPWILYHSGRTAEAEQAYAEIIDRFDQQQSTTTRELLRDARFMLSNLNVMKKEYGHAEEWLEQVLDEFPNDVGAMNDLGYLYADQSKHLRRSLRMVQRAVEKEPDNLAYRDSLGWTLFRLGKYDEARDQLESATGGQDTDGVILDHLGDVYRVLNQSEKAVQSWRKAVAAFEKIGDTERLDMTQRKIHNETKQKP